MWITLDSGLINTDHVTSISRHSSTAQYSLVFEFSDGDSTSTQAYPDEQSRDAAYRLLENQLAGVSLTRAAIQVRLEQQERGRV